MIESSSVEVGSRDLTRSVFFARTFGATLASSRRLALAALVVVAAAIRLVGLGATGFSEDEINKLRAVEAYSRHDFTANAEHPMLMKLADWASLSAAAWWNERQPEAAISPEAALRLPNAVAGAATAGVLFLLGEALFDTSVGVWAAALWALDVNAAAINRIGKEDTFLLLFLLIAAYCFERGKAIMHLPRQRDRWFDASGAAFGLMLASKYMPWYFGLHSAFNIVADRNSEGATAGRGTRFYVAMAAAFLVADFAVILPETWRYALGYVQGDTLRHTGYVFAHGLYVNGVEATPFGVPWWFYLTFLVTKVPIVVLGAALIGLMWVSRHWRHRGATFIRVFLLLTLFPYSLFASKFVRYLLPVLAMLNLAAAVGIVWLTRRTQRLRRDGAAIAVMALIAACVLVPLAVHASASAPYFSLAQNTIGARLTAAGPLFPDDEFYDAGVREAVAALALTASRGAVVCSDAAAVVEEYLARDGRTDVTACSIARDGLPMRAVETWVIVQQGHVYFENQLVIDQLQRRFESLMQVQVGGYPAADVYRFR